MKHRKALSETTVSGNASATVVFNSPKPVINSFTESDTARANTLNFSSTGVLKNAATFRWSVVGATSYQVIGPRGAIYSGTATSYFWPKGTTVSSPGSMNRNETWTLRALNGSSSSDYSIVINVDYADDPSEPSG